MKQKKNQKTFSNKKSFIFTLRAKPRRYPRTIADLFTLSILSGDKEGIAAFMQDPEARTSQNMRLLAKYVLGEIQKTRGPKQKKGASDFLIWHHYKTLRLQGRNRKEAIKETVEALDAAEKLPKDDLRYQVANRKWKYENVPKDVKEIVSKLDKVFDLEIAPLNSP